MYELGLLRLWFSVEASEESESFPSSSSLFITFSWSSSSSSLSYKKLCSETELFIVSLLYTPQRSKILKIEPEAKWRSDENHTTRTLQANKVVKRKELVNESTRRFTRTRNQLAIGGFREAIGQFNRLQDDDWERKQNRITWSDYERWTKWKDKRKWKLVGKILRVEKANLALLLCSLLCFALLCNSYKGTGNPSMSLKRFIKLN